MTGMAGSGSDFLYPFLGGLQPVSRDAVLAEVRLSIRRKAQDLVELRTSFVDANAAALVAAARDLARAFARGGHLFTFGNGGSATDAQDAAADFLDPGKGFRRLPALSLTNDIGVVTGVGNDVGFDNVFARQIIAHGRPGDAALGFSTSGESPNVLAAFAQARKQGLITLGLAGYEGGRMAAAGLSHCFVVRSTYVPRIQEVHATIYHTLGMLTYRILEADHEVC